MSLNIYPVSERPVAGFDAGGVSGRALARVVESHPALTPLLDFYSADPAEIAAEVGMVSPHDPEDADELSEIDLGPEEWFEPTWRPSSGACCWPVSTRRASTSPWTCERGDERPAGLQNSPGDTDKDTV